MRVAVIGTGVAGLACARRLADCSHSVHIFEKARGPGGRTSTRRAGALRFDHGAQYFTVRDARFGAAVERWRAAEVVARWGGRIVSVAGGRTSEVDDVTTRFVGVPRMSAICRELARGLDATFGTRITRLLHQQGAWQLESEDGSTFGSFDAVVVSAPAPQTAVLLERVAPELASRAAAIAMEPCWAGMVAFDEPLPLDYDAAFVHDAPLSWIARDASKPGRAASETWVLHGSPAWSRTRQDDDPETVARALLDALPAAVGVAIPEPTHLAAHRWLYAQPRAPRPEPCLLDGKRKLVACGDWCGGPRVEGAWLSGEAAAEHLLSGTVHPPLDLLYRGT